MRYVVLRHETPPGASRPSHWDLMFEVDPTAALRTWAIELPPDSATAQAARALPDHRREYLTYEGPVSGNRGSVARWDEGTYEMLPPPSDAPEAFVVRIAGRRLRGVVTITAGETPRYAYDAE
jgi:hypothetical protein